SPSSARSSSSSTSRAISARSKDRVQVEADAVAVLREAIRDADRVEPEEQEAEPAFALRREPELPLGLDVLEVLVAESELARRPVVPVGEDMRHQPHRATLELPPRHRHLELEPLRQAHQRTARSRIRNEAGQEQAVDQRGPSGCVRPAESAAQAERVEPCRHLLALELRAPARLPTHAEREALGRKLELDARQKRGVLDLVVGPAGRQLLVVEVLDTDRERQKQTDADVGSAAHPGLSNS